MTAFSAKNIQQVLDLANFEQASDLVNEAGTPTRVGGFHIFQNTKTSLFNVVYLPGTTDAGKRASEIAPKVTSLVAEWAEYLTGSRFEVETSLGKPFPYLVIKDYTGEEFPAEKEVKPAVGRTRKYDFPVEYPEGASKEEKSRIYHKARAIYFRDLAREERGVQPEGDTNEIKVGNMTIKVLGRYKIVAGHTQFMRRRVEVVSINPGRGTCTVKFLSTGKEHNFRLTSLGELTPAELAATYETAKAKPTSGKNKKGSAAPISKLLPALTPAAEELPAPGEQEETEETEEIEDDSDEIEDDDDEDENEDDEIFEDEEDLEA